MMNTKFELQHVVLYAKGWYERTDFWEDIRKCLTADGYSGDIMTKKDMAGVIFNQFNKLDRKGGMHDSWFILNEITEQNCWKYGYYTKDNIRIITNKETNFEQYEYYKAIVQYCLAYFLRITSDEWNVRFADEKVLPLKKEL